MISTIQLSDKQIQILNHHGFPFRRFNSAANYNPEVFNHFNDIIQIFKPDYVVGDFNTEDYMELVESFKENYIRTIEQVTTVDGKKFDDILIKKNNQYSNVEILKLLSDHYLAIINV